MSDTLRCPKCDSIEWWAGAVFGSDRLEFQAQGATNAMPSRFEMQARVCGECGYAELSLTNSERARLNEAKSKD